MQKPGQDPVAKDDVPVWLKYAGRGLGTVGSFSKFSRKTFRDTNSFITIIFSAKNVLQLLIKMHIATLFITINILHKDSMFTI